MKQIVKDLTDEQMQRFKDIYIPEWTEIGMCTAPTDIDKTLEQIEKIYQVSGHKMPKEHLHFDSPLQIAEYLKHERGSEIQNHADILSSFCYGSMEARWMAFYQYFMDEFPDDIAPYLEEIVPFIELSKLTGWWSAWDEVVLTSERPSVINLNKADRLHHDSAPALVYPNNSLNIYAINGTVIPDWYIKEPEKITVNTIEEEDNSELRRIMTNFYGETQYLKDSGAELIHEEGKGIKYRALYLKEVEDDEPIMRVRVINQSPEAPGTFDPKSEDLHFENGEAYKIYWLPVHHELRPLIYDKEANKRRRNSSDFDASESPILILGEPQELTCHNAVASTFGKYGHEYMPDIET